MTRETGESLPYFSSITCRSENQSKHIGPIKYRCEGSSSVYTCTIMNSIKILLTIFILFINKKKESLYYEMMSL